MGDIDVSSTVVVPGDVDAEIESFDGRLNAWLMDFSAQTPFVGQAFIDQVDAFVFSWREFKDEFFVWGTNKLAKLLQLEANFNKLKAQADALAQQHGGPQSTIADATVKSKGKEYSAGNQPWDEDIVSRLTSLVKWGGVLLAAGLAVKVSSDLGLFKKLGAIAQKRTA